MKQQLHIKILIFLIIANFKTVKAQTFTELTTANLPGLSYSSSAWGDYDNDGDLDVLLSGLQSSGYLMSSIFRNNGNGTFTDINAGLFQVYSSSVAWGDFDSDGDLDILLTGNRTSGIPVSAIYRNNGDNTFTNINASLTGVWSSSAAWGDYDNDGDLDILITGNSASGSSQVRISEIYRNNGDASFTNINAGLPGVMVSTVAWGDYDNDGDLDILLTGATGYGTQISEIYRNNGDATFTTISAGLTGVQYGSAAWGDYDNDGDLDVLLTGSTWVSSASKIFRNNGNGTFTDINAGLDLAWESSAAWGDYDNDGDLDVLLAGHHSIYFSKIYKNNGNATFTDISAGLPPIFLGSVAWADFDNDGDLDALLTGKGFNELRTRIFVNNNAQSNSIPSPPSNLTAVVNGNDVALSWSASTDTETPSNGLSYNVYIKEVPTSTSIYLKSPMASEINGWRKLPALGNAMQNTSYKYKVPASLVNSNFTFEVQAIDSGFAGSVFSEEGSFATLGIETIDEGRGVKIYPNPVANNLIIDTLFSGNLQLQVFNQLGQIVLKQNQNTSSNLLDVSNLSKGLYFLNINSENGETQTIKFVKN